MHTPLRSAPPIPDPVAAGLSLAHRDSVCAAQPLRHAHAHAGSVSQRVSGGDGVAWCTAIALARTPVAVDVGLALGIAVAIRLRVGVPQPQRERVRVALACGASAAGQQPHSDGGYVEVGAYQYTRRRGCARRGRFPRAAAARLPVPPPPPSAALAVQVALLLQVAPAHGEPFHVSLHHALGDAGGVALAAAAVVQLLVVECAHAVCDWQPDAVGDGLALDD